jgi:Transglycosylase SLT domain
MMVSSSIPPIQWTPRFVASSVYRALAFVVADRHAIGRSLVCAVCEEESGKRNTVSAYGIEDWDPFAVRFEPAFESRYIKPPNPAMPSTEQLCLAMSFGLMQIMGQTARERGFAGKFLTGLCDPETGLEYGCRQLRRCIDLSRGDPSSALLRWNGGSDTGYPSRVLSRMEKFT